MATPLIWFVPEHEGPCGRCQARRETFDGSVFDSGQASRLGRGRVQGAETGHAALQRPAFVYPGVGVIATERPTHGVMLLCCRSVSPPTDLQPSKPPVASWSTRICVPASASITKHPP